MSIQLEVLGLEGHTSVVFDERVPEERDRLAEKVSSLMRQGARCFLRSPEGNHFLIRGYDEDNHAWLTSLKPHIMTPLSLANGQSVTVVPRISGG